MQGEESGQLSKSGDSELSSPMTCGSLEVTAQAGEFIHCEFRLRELDMSNIY